MKKLIISLTIVLSVLNMNGIKTTANDKVEIKEPVQQEEVQETIILSDSAYNV